MEFCPKCGMRLILNTNNSDKNVSYLLCPKCGYQKRICKEELTHKTISQSQREKIAVIGEEEAKIRTMSTVKIECPKCYNKEAYWWMVQTRGSDESPTQFFRCTQCNYTWREMT